MTRFSQWSSWILAYVIGFWALAGCVTTRETKSSTPHALSTQQNPWFTGSWLQVSQTALVEGKLVMMVISRDDCLACSWLDLNVFHRKDFRNRQSMVITVPVKPGSPDYRDYIERFTIQQEPTIILADPGGNTVFRFDPEVNAEEFAKGFAMAVGVRSNFFKVIQRLKHGEGTQDEWRWMAWWDWRDYRTAGYSDNESYLSDLEFLVDHYPSELELEKTRLSAKLILGFAKWGGTHPDRRHVQAFGRYYWSSLFANEELLGTIREPFLRESVVIAAFLYPQSMPEREEYLNRWRLAARELGDIFEGDARVQLWVIRAEAGLNEALESKGMSHEKTSLVKETRQIWNSQIKSRPPSELRTALTAEVADLMLLLGDRSGAIEILMAGLGEDPQSSLMRSALTNAQQSDRKPDRPTKSTNGKGKQSSPEEKQISTPESPPMQPESGNRSSIPTTH